MNPKDFDSIIEEPFLTEEGFVNQACMNALDAAIANVPPVHERLAHDTEWSTPRVIYRYWLTAGLAKWAIRQSPYHMPDHLGEVIGYLDACLRRDVKADEYGLCKMSLCQISEYLHKNLVDLPYFRAWNEPKIGKATMMFTSSYDGPRDPDTDFIELDALLRNVCLEIRDEWRASDRFDAKFAEEHPEFQET